MPFTEDMTQILVYAKFLKEILANKRILEENETISMTLDSSVTVQNMLPTKRKGPWSFSIPCSIGNMNSEKGLCDLGDCVSLLPLSVCKKIDIGEVRLIDISLQLADRTIKHPMCVLEDIPVRIGEFYKSVDFVIMDIEEDYEIPIILGRSFLATTCVTP